MQSPWNFCGASRGCYSVERYPSFSVSTCQVDEDDMEEKLKEMMRDDLDKAYEALSRYKFYMFGYYAAAWVRYNKLLAKPLPNPFAPLVQAARAQKRA